MTMMRMSTLAMTCAVTAATVGGSAHASFLLAGSTFDFGTSLGNALPSTGGAWPPPPAVDLVAEGAFTLGNGETATFTNNAIWGGINASAWIESLTFEVQSAAVPAPFAASGAAVLFALAGPFGRLRRRR